MADNSSTRLSRRTFIAASGTAGSLALAGCTSNPNANGGDGGNEGDDSDNDGGGSGGSGSLSGQIEIAGSSTVFPLSTQMKQEFQKEHPAVSISIKSTGSGGGFANYFCTGETDFNNASRPIKDEEKQQCQESDVTPIELKVATDALTVVVNPEADWFTDGECITVEQLKTVWSAESKPTKWSDVESGWPDEEIKLYGPTDASGTYDYFIEAIIGEDGPGHRTDYSATEQDNTIIQGVSRDQYAIGYLGFAYYTENKDSVKALGVDSGDGCVKPTLETAKSGEYSPLSRPLFTYPAKEALGKEQVASFAKFFVENSTSKEIVAEKVGYVPNSEDEATSQMEKLQQAIDG